jgi:WD40 repeat protein
MGEERQNPEKEKNPAQKFSGLKGIAIGAGLAFLGLVNGVLGKGGFDVSFDASKLLLKPLLHELAASPNGRLLVGATPGGAILLAGSKDREVFDFFYAFPKPPRMIIFSPDSTKLLLISDDNIVIVWNLTSNIVNKAKGQQAVGQTARFQLPWEPDSVQFSIDNQTEVFRHDGEEWVFDDHGKQVASQ